MKACVRAWVLGVEMSVCAYVRMCVCVCLRAYVGVHVYILCMHMC